MTSGPKLAEASIGRRSTTVRRKRSGWRAHLLFLLFAGPNIALLVAFVYRPLGLNIYYSLLQWNLGSTTARFIGFSNYSHWWHDPETPTVLMNTLVFTVATVAGSIVLGLVVAVALNRKIFGGGTALTLLFAPYAVSGVAMGLLWLYIFDPNNGLLETVLSAFGVSSPQWYTDGTWSMVMIIIVYLWQHIGYVALIYMAGMKSIPGDLLQAAALDGASSRQIFRKVVLPLLGPITMFLVITCTLSSLQTFDITKTMTDGGPLNATTTLIYEVYQQGFVNGLGGYGSAVATILFILLLAVTGLQLRFMERRVHYA